MRNYFQPGDKVKYYRKEGIIKQIAYRSLDSNSLEMDPQAMISFDDGTYVWEDISQLQEMNIKEKFILAITPEPKRTFRKAGITNGDDILTEEGQKIFLTWLLHNKFADEFKKDVVEEMLEVKKDAE